MTGDPVIDQLIISAQDTFRLIWEVFAATWWFWLWVALLPLFRDAWLFWRQEMFRQHQKYAIFEIFVPREITKGPRAMDQVFQAIHALTNQWGDFEEQYLDGELPRPFTFEIVSFGGETHFYVRGYHKIGNLIQSAFLAHYPDVEVVQVDDYMSKLPRTWEELESKNYDMYATELVLSRHPMFPTRTYIDFEVPAEELQVDPIGAILEVLGKLKKDEFIGIQINCHKSFNKKYWGKRENPKTGEIELVDSSAQKILSKLREKTEYNPETGIFTYGIISKREAGVLEAVERNIALPAFEAVVRLMYFSPRAVFYDSFPRRGIIGAFNQYAAEDLNSFRQNFGMMTLTKLLFSPYVFPRYRAIIRKKRILKYYRERTIPQPTWTGRIMRNHIFGFDKSEVCILSSTVLATIFHPPMNVVLTAPHLRRSESKKAGPSSGLPIYGEEKSIEKFQ
jgi:hypothetical protein